MPFAGLHYTDRQYDADLPGLVCDIYLFGLACYHSANLTAKLGLKQLMLCALQTIQQRQVLSYPDGDQFLNVARNPRSPFYSSELAAGAWDALPASATVSKL